MAPVAVTPSESFYSSPFHVKETFKPKEPTVMTLPLRWRPTLVTQAQTRTTFAFDTMEDALNAFSRGEFLVVMDDENRENEGDLIIAAELCSTEKMAWMIKHTSGYICISLPGDRLEALDIPMMVPENQERHRTAYTVTVDYKHGTSTGISAHDRALTARALASPTAQPSDFTRPGHMVPLRAREGGVLTRKGHTESAVDLCRLTGLAPVGLLCELVNDDAEGTMARRDDCRAFADRWGLRMISVEMLVELRRQQEASEDSNVSVKI
jgi:3,4-dihydroxy-2-butanone 4-phosphate synthase